MICSAWESELDFSESELELDESELDQFDLTEEGELSLILTLFDAQKHITETLLLLTKNEHFGDGKQIFSVFVTNTRTYRIAQSQDKNKHTVRTGNFLFTFRAYYCI